ncbi:MAG: hypothetical protein FWG17_05470 [Desulfovibrionaceae bacterium]|nr:hypothetical protein [Desulfovibrionaceae bacterium]
MTTLDSLRKEYDKLNTFERAVMVAEAASRADGEAISALEPPSLWDAFHCLNYGRLFMGLAFYAVHLSQLADKFYWMAVAAHGAIDSVERAKRKAKLEELNTRADKMEDKRLAWLLALQTLDSEIGGGCMACARAIAGSYIDNVLSDEMDPEEFAYELAHLREAWTAVSEDCPDAPKAKEPAATEIRQ